MSSKNGGSAFPVIQENMVVPEGGPGMTLRDYFAGQALVGLVSRFTLTEPVLAEYAYCQADAMLAERLKETSNDPE